MSKIQSSNHLKHFRFPTWDGATPATTAASLTTSALPLSSSQSWRTRASRPPSTPTRPAGGRGRRRGHRAPSYSSSPPPRRCGVLPSPKRVRVASVTKETERERERNKERDREGEWERERETERGRERYIYGTKCHTRRDWLHNGQPVCLSCAVQIVRQCTCQCCPKTEDKQAVSFVQENCVSCTTTSVLVENTDRLWPLFSQCQFTKHLLIFSNTYTECFNT